VFDEAELWAPQRPTPEGTALLGRIEEIVRRGRVRGFIPWLIRQRPAVLHKDVLSQADTLIAMKLTSSQDRAAVGPGSKARPTARRASASWPTCRDCSGAKATSGRPGARCCSGCAFPAIRTFDSSRTPARGERIATTGALALVDLAAIMAALESAAAEPAPARAHRDDRRTAALERQLAEARDCAAVLAQENADLRRRLSEIASFAAGQAEEQPAPDINAAVPNQGMPAPVAAVGVPSRRQGRKSSHREPKVVTGSGGKGAELRILRVHAQQAPGAASGIAIGNPVTDEAHRRYVADLQEPAAQPRSDCARRPRMVGRPKAWRSPALCRASRRPPRNCAACGRKRSAAPAG